MEEQKQHEHDEDEDLCDEIVGASSSFILHPHFLMTTSKLFSCRINVFNLLLKDSLVWQFVGPPAKHQQHGRGRMIAADHALLMTLLEQIKLWVINLDTESMHAIGFIRVSLTSEAFIRHKAKALKWLIMKCHS